VIYTIPVSASHAVRIEADSVDAAGERMGIIYAEHMHAQGRSWHGVEVAFVIVDESCTPFEVIVTLQDKERMN